MEAGSALLGGSFSGGEPQLAGPLREAAGGGDKRVDKRVAAAPGLGARSGSRSCTLDPELAVGSLAMGLRRRPDSAALLSGGLLCLLLLADPTPVRPEAGRHPPVVLGKARIQAWVLFAPGRAGRVVFLGAVVQSGG